MNYSNYSLVLIVALWAAPSHAVEAKKNDKAPKLAANAQSEFYIEQGLVEKVYDTSVEAQRRSSQANGDIRMEAAIGVLSPSQLTVSNEYFDVDHAANGGNLPFLNFTASRKLMARSRNDFYLEGQAGYGTRQAEHEVHSTVGIDVEDMVTLQWLPVGALFRVEHRPTWTTAIKPALAAGAGATWINQRGTLEGIDQSYWVPTWTAGPALTFFGGDGRDQSAFGGIVASALYQRGLNPSAQVAGWAFSMGSRVHL